MTPNDVLAWHLRIIGTLAAAFAVVAIADQFGHHQLLGLSALFRLDREANFPSGFSSLALLVASLAAWAVRGALPPGHRERTGWTLFAGVFLFMSADELMRLHEMIHRPAGLAGYDSWFHYFGVFPYLLLAGALGIGLFPFWLWQRPRIRIGLLGGGSVYVAAAIGMEMVENHLVAAGATRFGAQLATSYFLEEIGEMVAVAVFLNAFLTRLAEAGGGLVVPLRTIAAPVSDAASSVPTRAAPLLAPALQTLDPR